MTPPDSMCDNVRVGADAPEDRRRQRSSDPLVALHYQLAHARDQAQVDAMVLADDSGVLVAGSGPWALCEELAAYAPLLAEALWCEPGLRPTGPMGELRTGVDVLRLDADGQAVFLCARGGWMRAEAMKLAAEGVARILTSH
jgi:hypothetical protein